MSLSNNRQLVEFH